MSSHVKDFLLSRKKDLEEQLKKLKPIQDELDEVNHLLTTYDKPKRGGWETPGHENGCRCRECDPSR